jgi:2C-methyl-D-erythritol 2,4-cyclodiphosphate synthase
MKKKRAKAFLKKLEKYSSKDAVMKATKLTQKRIYHRSDIDVEVLYDSPKLYCVF